MTESCDTCERLQTQLHAVTVAIAKRRGREVVLDGRQKFWLDQGRILLASHGACVVCSRQTRWRVRVIDQPHPGATFYAPCCSRACYRTRFEA